VIPDEALREAEGMLSRGEEGGGGRGGGRGRMSARFEF